MTGCTVVLFPAGTVASGEVRGGAPGTREFALLSPERMVTRVDAVVLSGGSAFGLAACDGVVQWCEERGMGFPTVAGPVPIVVGAVLYDLAVGDPCVRPGPANGYAACVAATAGAVQTGAIGAGAGATVNKWQGPENARPGGVGTASVREGELVVAALVAVNAFGEVRGPGAAPPGHVGPGEGDGHAALFTNTTIGVVATNASLDKRGCLLAAQGGHDGLARALEPVHTTVDGDALVVAATNHVDAGVDQVRVLAARAVEQAVRSAVAAASPPDSAGPESGVA